MESSVGVSLVSIGKRFRKDMGDLQSLADSIKAHGLLQPIGVTKDNKLVFGERRLRACRDILKWDYIPARVVDVTSLLEAERDENEVRKEFTISERVAIGKAIEEEMAERRGKDNVANLPELKGKATREIAAEKAGFGSASSYRHAKQVAESGIPALVEAVDRGEVSISAGAKVAELPKSQQKRLVSQGKVKEAAAAKRPKSDEVEKLKAELEDALGRAEEMAKAQQPLQDEVDFLRKIEDEGDKLKAACAEVKKLQERVRVQEERIRGLTRAHGEAVKAAKTAQAQVARLEKELAKVSA